MPDPASPTPSRRRRIGSAVFLVLFTTAMGVRMWLHQREKADRERMMQALMESSRETNRKIDERMREEFRRQQQEEAARTIARLEQIQRDLEHPPAPGSRPSTPAPEPSRRSAVEMPHHFVVTNADLARAPVREAPAGEFRDRAAGKALAASLGAVYDELRVMLGDRERFPDYARVAALLPRVEAAAARIDAVLRDGAWKKMAVKNTADLIADLRDFAAAVAAKDGGVPDAGGR